jgi:hypothetical protein
MASEKDPPSGNKRRRRPPTVINLEATEVDAGAGMNAPRTGESAPAAAAAANQPSPPPPGEIRDDPPSGAGASSTNRMFAWLPEELSWTQVSAGVAGAAGGLLVFFLLWLIGAFQSGREASADLTPRLASIEQQLRELAARPAPTAVDPKAIEALGARLAGLERAQAAPRPMPASVDPKVVEQLASRIAKLESASSAPRPPVTDPVVLSRIAAAERSVKSAGDNIMALSQRADRADAAMRDANGRLDKLSAAFTELQTGLRAAAVGSDRAVRLAVAAATMRAAVESGAPFAAELATVKSLLPGGEATSALEPFAASGLPTDAALGKELAVIMRPMLRAMGGKPVPAGGSFLERLQANAEKLVRIRPTDEVKGDDRSAILARIEKRAAQADIDGALAELEKLPAAARGPAQGWIAKVHARSKAAETSRRITAEAVAALKAAP